MIINTTSTNNLPINTAPTIYPCSRGTGVPSGYHHFESGPTGIIFCRYCGHVASQGPLKVTYSRPENVS